MHKHCNHLPQQHFSDSKDSMVYNVSSDIVILGACCNIHRLLVISMNGIVHFPNNNNIISILDTHKANKKLSWIDIYKQMYKCMGKLE